MVKLRGWRRQFVLVFLCAQCAAPDSRAQNAASCAREFSRLAPINLKGSQFEVNRGLERYFELFARAPHLRQFEKSLQGLKPGQVWMDAGAGNALALREYLEQGGKAKVLGVGFEAPSDRSYSAFQKGPHARNFRYLHGDLFENMSNREIGKVDLITDVVGIGSYTRAFDVTIRKYLEVLNHDGVAYIHLTENKTNIAGPNGPVSLLDYFRRIKGAEVERTGNGFFILRRTARNDAEIHVPPLRADPSRFNETNVPPLRYFDLVE